MRVEEGGEGEMRVLVDGGHGTCRQANSIARAALLPIPVLSSGPRALTPAG